MRAARLLGVPFGALIATAFLMPLGVPTARAQEADVHLTLVRQTSFATPGDPVQIKVRAANEGAETFPDLTVSLTLYNPARSRSEYRDGLDSEPPTAPLLLASDPVSGTLDPGQARKFSLTRDLPELATTGENALYPMKVQLESEGVAVAVLRSALVFIGEPPLVPLNVSLTFVIDERLPSGTGGLLTEAVEASIAPDGRLQGLLSTFERTPVRMTLAVSPILLGHLERMSDGYVVRTSERSRRIGANEPGAQRAADAIERIRSLARDPDTEVVALPFARPQIPALVDSGLIDDLERQIARGREEVERLLSVRTEDSILRPPGSAISDDAIPVLADRGIATLLVDSDTLPPPEGLVLSPGARARVGDGAGRFIDAIAPDPGLVQLAAQLPDDPRLRAQWVIGDLSALYFEQPSVVRGVALLFDAAAEAPEPRFLSSLLGILNPNRVPSEVAWLAPKKVTQLVGSVPVERRNLPARPFDRFSPGYLNQLAGLRDLIAQFRGAAPDGPLAERLGTRVLLAEAQEFLEQESDGLGVIRSARQRVFREFRKIEPPPSGAVVTLTSRSGDIPVTIRNVAGYPVRVRVTLVSPRLEFLGRNPIRINLTREVHQLTFPVRAQTNGRFPVTILVETRGGLQMNESNIVVRSTAYNRAALILTIGAAAFLALWWGRRFLPRRTS